MIKKISTKVKKDNNLIELLKNSGIAFFLKILGIIAGFIFTLLISKNFGAAALGIFTLSITLLQLYSTIGKMGLDIALLKFTAEFVAQNKWGTIKDIYYKSLLLAIVTSFLLSVIVFFCSNYIATHIFNKPFIEDSIKLISIAIIPYVFLILHTEAIRGLKQIKVYMLLQQTIVFFLASVLLIISTFLTCEPISYDIPFITYLIAISTVSVISIYIWYQYLKKHKINKNYNNINKYYVSYKKILAISLPMLLSSALSMVMNWTDVIMLGIIRTSDEVGVYNVALKLAMITSITLHAINSIAAPKFAEFWGKNDIDRLMKVAKQSAKLIFWTSFPILLIVFIFSDTLLTLFGSEFKAGKAALIILLLGQLFNAISGSVGYILMMTEYQKFHQTVILISVLLNVILNYILIPLYGIMGAAIASSISYIFWNSVFTYKIKKEFGSYIFYIPLTKGSD